MPSGGGKDEQAPPGPPDPGPRGYVYTRDTRTRWARRPERDRRADFVRRNVKAWTYAPIGYSGQLPGEGCWPSRPAAAAAAAPAPPSTAVAIAPSPNPAAGPETSWEGRGASPLLVPRIVRSQCPRENRGRPGGGEGEGEGEGECCAFRFVSEKRYQAHMMEAHGRSYGFLVGVLAGRSAVEDNLYYPRRRPERAPGVVERRAPEGPDRLRLSMAELRREAAREGRDLTRPRWEEM